MFQNLILKVASAAGATVLGLIVLVFVLWYGLSYLSREGVIPIGTFGIVLIIVAVVLIAAGVFLWRRFVAAKGAEAIEDSMRDQADEQVAFVRPDRQAEIEELKGKFEESLGALRNSKLGKGALYAMPWYIIVGPPGCGKTTMLTESGLNFPYMKDQDRGVRGVGGTRNCDWWFADRGILLDTAGRYMAESEDHEEWMSFLGMLKRARRHKPINGVIVAISVEDLMGTTEEGVEKHASKIRDRLDELTDNLELVFPIYLVFTKCDLMDGFVETFRGMTREERAQVWGCTFDDQMTADKEVWDVFDEQFEGLYKRLCEFRLGLLNRQRPRAEQQRIFAFPLQFGQAKDRLTHFVKLLCQPNPFHEGSKLRGFYFSSGVQVGAPIDRVVARIAERIEVLPEDSDDEFASGGVEGQAYFIDDLFMKVIFPDQHIARSSTKAVVRRRWLRRAGLVACGVATVLGLWGLVSNFFGNRSVILAARAAIDDGRSIDFADGEIDDREKQALSALLESFLELEGTDGGRLFARSHALRDEVRSNYIRALRVAFLDPAYFWLTDRFTEGQEVLKTRPFEIREIKKFGRQVKLAEALTGQIIDEVVLRELMTTENNLWRWRREDLGKELRQTDWEAKEHLEAYIDVVRKTGELPDGRYDWEVVGKRQFVSDFAKALKPEIDAVIAELLPEDSWVHFTDDGFVSDFQADLFVDPTAFRIRTKLTWTKAQIEIAIRESVEQGFPSVKPGTADFENYCAMVREGLDERRIDDWTRAIGAMRGVKPFLHLRDASEQLPEFLGSGATTSQYHAVYFEALQQFIAHDQIVEGADASRQTAIDQISRALDKVGAAQAILKTELTEVVGDPVEVIVRRLRERDTAKIIGLAEDLDSARRGVGTELQNLHGGEKLRRPLTEAIRGLIDAVAATFKHAVRQGANRYWRELLGTKNALNSFQQFPFKQRVSDEVVPPPIPVPDFLAILGRGGKFDRAVETLDQLEQATLGGLPLIQYESWFDEGDACDRRKVTMLQDALGLSADASSFEVRFRVELDKVGNKIQNVELFINGGSESTAVPKVVSIKRNYPTPARHAQERVWTPEDRGAKLECEPIGWVAIDPLNIQTNASDQWDFLRLVFDAFDPEKNKNAELGASRLHYRWFVQQVSNRSSKTEIPVEIIATKTYNAFDPRLYELEFRSEPNIVKLQ